MADADGSLHGYNLFAYCFNNPVMMTDTSGTWPSWEDIGNWFAETFGVGVVQEQKYEESSGDHLLWGYEDGYSSTKVICGDISKPISFYVTNASEWWKIWEYRAGFQINVYDGGFATSVGLGEISAIGVIGDNSVEVVAGINKIGYTAKSEFNFGQRTGGGYVHGYIRTIPAVALALGSYFTSGAIIPVAIPMLN